MKTVNFTENLNTVRYLKRGEVKLNLRKYLTKKTRKKLKKG
jgi:hypothetical protein